MRPCSGTVLYMEWISAQPPIQRLSSVISSHQPGKTLQDSCTSCLMLMSACHSLISHSPLKAVFGKIGDTHQAYCHTYKTHTMATHHGGSGQPLGGDINDHEATDTDIEQTQDFYHVNANDFEESDPNNPSRLTLITRELDELCQQIQAGEGQPSEALNCIDHELQRLSISLCPSAPPEPH